MTRQWCENQPTSPGIPSRRRPSLPTVSTPPFRVDPRTDPFDDAPAPGFHQTNRRVPISNAAAESFAPMPSDPPSSPSSERKSCPSIGPGWTSLTETSSSGQRSKIWFYPVKRHGALSFGGRKYLVKIRAKERQKQIVYKKKSLAVRRKEQSKWLSRLK